MMMTEPWFTAQAGNTSLGTVMSITAGAGPGATVTFTYPGINGGSGVPGGIPPVAFELRSLRISTTVGGKITFRTTASVPVGGPAPLQRLRPLAHHPQTDRHLRIERQPRLELPPHSE